jgi:hypothetical protein
VTPVVRIDQGLQGVAERDRRTANQILNAAVTYARLILRKYGELGAFGFSMDREGQVVRETLEIPRLPRDPQRLWKLLAEHLAQRVRRGAIVAMAMGADVTLSEPSAEGYSDAVVVNIEAESGYAIEAIIPYKIYGGQLRNLLPRRIALGRMVVQDAVGRIFTAQREPGLS